MQKRIRIATGLGVAGIMIVGGGWRAAARSAAVAPPAPSGKVAPWTAMKSAAAKVNGRALNALFEYEDGHWQYGVMVLTGKTIKEVEVNATTGQVGDVEDVDPVKEGREVQQELQNAIAGKH